MLAFASWATHHGGSTRQGLLGRCRPWSLGWRRHAGGEGLRVLAANVAATLAEACARRGNALARTSGAANAMTSWAPVWDALSAGRVPVPSPGLQTDELALLVGPPATFWLCVWCVVRHECG